MSSVTPNNARWAIAANVTAVTLEALRSRLPKPLRGEGSKVIVGDDFAALLVFGENASEGESAAARLASEVSTPVYLLDFDDDAPAITELSKGRERRKRGHPADFLEERGIVAPGHEPATPIVQSVGIVEDLTPAQARKLFPRISAASLQPHPRGTLVTSTGFDAMSLALRAKRRGYIVGVDRSDNSFSCEIVEPGPKVVQFAPTKPSGSSEQIDSVLGETTLDGILGVLGIPRALLP